MQTIKKVCEPSLFVFSAKYFLTNVFGAYAAHFSVCECGSDAVPVSEAKDAARNFALMTSGTESSVSVLDCKGTAYFVYFFIKSER